MSEVHVPTKNTCEDNSITLLARDPNWLYVYWELSDSNIKTFIQEFGEELWEKSIPVLKVTNISKNDIFYIRINGFSNNWYINVPDSNCLYMVEIGRKISEHFFISLSNSNCIVTPADFVSPNTTAYFANYTDIKNGILEPVSISGLSSPELFGTMDEESYFGDSSAQLYGINLSEHLGVSSESFMKG